MISFTTDNGDGDDGDDDDYAKDDDDGDNDGYVYLISSRCNSAVGDLSTSCNVHSSTRITALCFVGIPRMPTVFTIYDQFVLFLHVLSQD